MTPDDYKNVSSVKNSDLAANLSNITADSLKNITNNTGMLAMSQRSLDEFHQTASSMSGTIVMMSAPTSELCAVESGVTSCQLSTSQQLSDTSSPVIKVNVTNNAYLAALSRQSLQHDRQSAISVNVDRSQLAVSTAFPSKPDVPVIDQFTAALATPWPVFRSPAAEPTEDDDDAKASAETPAKPKDLSKATELPQTLKPALVKTDASRVRQDATSYVQNVISAFSTRSYIIHLTLSTTSYLDELITVIADLPGAVGASVPIGKGSMGACTQRKNCQKHRKNAYTVVN